jgi:hypothetical protein
MNAAKTSGTTAAWRIGTLFAPDGEGADPVGATFGFWVDDIAFTM